MLHDRKLDRFIDDIRAAVLRGSGQENRPATRIVDGLLVARAYTDGVELTGLEQDVLAELEPIVSGHSGLGDAVDDLVAELDAVADVLFSQAVHALLRGDAGVAAPTLAATGSADSGLPAVDFPETLRGGRLITQRVIAVLGRSARAWPGAATSVLAVAEPRLEAWAGELLGPPTNVVADVTSGGKTRRVNLGVLRLAALDAVYGVERLGGRLLEALGAAGDGAIASGRPADLPDDKLSFDELVTLARAVRAVFGRIRPLADVDLTTDAEVADSRDAGELATRLAAALALVPADDVRRTLLGAHEIEHPGSTADLLIERLRILTVEPVPILPLLAAGIPAAVAASFTARQAASAQAQSRISAWLAQAARVRVDLSGFLDAVQLSELASLRVLLSCTVGQSPDTGGAWAGDKAPEGTRRSHGLVQRHRPAARRPRGGVRRRRVDRDDPGRQGDVRDRGALRQALRRRAERRPARRDPRRRELRPRRRASLRAKRTHDGRVPGAEPRRGPRLPEPVPSRGVHPGRRGRARRGERGVVTWFRLEGSSRDPELTEGLTACVADPLWTLARQLQVGEFHGEDAASPILVEAEVAFAPLTAFAPGDAPGGSRRARASGRGPPARGPGRAGIGRGRRQAPAGARLDPRPGVRTARSGPEGARPPPPALPRRARARRQVSTRPGARSSSSWRADRSTASARRTSSRRPLRSTRC